MPGAMRNIVLGLWGAQDLRIAGFRCGSISDSGGLGERLGMVELRLMAGAAPIRFQTKGWQLYAGWKPEETATR